MIVVPSPAALRTVLAVLFLAAIPSVLAAPTGTDPARVNPASVPSDVPEAPTYVELLESLASSNRAPTAQEFERLEALARQDAVAAHAYASADRSSSDGTVQDLEVPPGAREFAEALAARPPLQGDAATACEVILCLAGSVGAGGRVAECVPPIRRYLSILPPNLFRKRLNFLRMCPTVEGSRDAHMDTLVEAMVEAPGHDDGLCTAAALNVENRRDIGGGLSYIEPTMPAACRDYFGHPYTDLQARVPVYVGEPMEGGFWADPEGIHAARARYEAERQQRALDAPADDASSPGHPRSAYSRL